MELAGRFASCNRATSFVFEVIQEMTVTDPSLLHSPKHHDIDGELIEFRFL